MRIALVTVFLAGLVVGQTRDGAFNQFLNRVFTRESIEKYDNIQIDFTGLGNPKATIRTIFQDRLKYISRYSDFFENIPLKYFPWSMSGLLIPDYDYRFELTEAFEFTFK